MTNSTIDGSEFKQRCQQVLAVAKQLHANKPEWITLFREILGVDGAARSVFQEKDDFSKFEKSKEYDAIQTMINSLRDKKPKNAKDEETKVITVRLPESLHEALKAEAAEHRTSMNKLCISKLLQALVEEEERNAEMSRQASAASEARPEPRVDMSTPTGGFTMDPKTTEHTPTNFRSSYPKST